MDTWQNGLILFSFHARDNEEHSLSWLKITQIVSLVSLIRYIRKLISKVIPGQLSLCSCVINNCELYAVLKLFQYLIRANYKKALPNTLQIQGAELLIMVNQCIAFLNLIVVLLLSERTPSFYVEDKLLICGLHVNRQVLCAASAKQWTEWPPSFYICVVLMINKSSLDFHHLALFFVITGG